MVLFAALELVLVMAVPFLGIAGYHALLESKAGNFARPPAPDEPGWRALLDPTPVMAVVEVDEGSVTGIALLVDASLPDVGDVADGGLQLYAAEMHTVILVPGSLHIDGSPLSAHAPDAAMEILSEHMRLAISHVEVVGEERWASVMGATKYLLPNPDPVNDDLVVGEVEVNADNAAAFLGRPAPGMDPITVMFRRQAFWDAVMQQAPTGPDPLASTLQSLEGAMVEVVPLQSLDPNPRLEPVATEALIRDVVPFPSSPLRAQVRLIDRTGLADLNQLAAEFAALGFEVIEIGNAATFDAGPTELFAPEGIDVSELEMSTGATAVRGGTEVSLTVGADFLASRISRD